MLMLEDAEDAELTMVLLGNAPSQFFAKLLQQEIELWKRGSELRAQLPAYLEQQRSFIIAHCPSPGILRLLVAEYAAVPRRKCGLTGYVCWASTEVYTRCEKKSHKSGQPYEQARHKSLEAECKWLRGYQDGRILAAYIGTVAQLIIF
jgi:hypothetical protein